MALPQVIIRLATATNKLTGAAQTLYQAVEILDKSVREAEKRAGANKNGTYDDTVSLNARGNNAVRNDNYQKFQTSFDTALSQLFGDLSVNLSALLAERMGQLAQAVDDNAPVHLKTKDGILREREQLSAKLDKIGLDIYKLYQNPNNTHRETEARDLRQDSKEIQERMKELGYELRDRDELERLEAESKQLIEHQAQTNKVIAGDIVKETLPAAIEQVKADCSCIEQAFAKYFSKDNLSALCCNGSDEVGNDNALVGSAGDDIMYGGAGNDPLSGGGYNSGFDLAENYSFYGMGQQAMRNSLLPDPRKENEQAQELEGIYKTVSNTIGNSFTQLFQDVIVRGKSFRESLSSLFGNIANSLLNTFLDKVMGSLSKGISGFVEQALPSIFNFFFAANGGVMTSGGPLPLRTYAKGGIATSPQMAIFGEGSMNEAYVPLPDGRRIPVNMNMEGKPANDRGNVYQITQNVTVQGTPGQSQEESDRVAAQMMDSLDRAMTEKIDDRIRQSQRVGGISNPLRRIA